MLKITVILIVGSVSSFSIPTFLIAVLVGAAVIETIRFIFR